MDLSYRIVAGVEKGRIGKIRIEPGRPVWIGRADESYGTSIVLPDGGVSALHACIVLEADGWPAICDNRSTNGLFRLGQTVQHATFRSGERFQVGRGGPEVEFFYAEEPGASGSVPAHAPAPSAPIVASPPPTVAYAFPAGHASPHALAGAAPGAPPKGYVAAPTPHVPMPVMPPAAPPAPSGQAPGAAAGQASPKPHPSLPARTRTAQTERARKAVTTEAYVPIERVPGRDPIIVFRAKRPGIDHEVMIEVLLHNTEYETPDERRFLRAARLAAKLHHPNVIALYDARITDDYDLLVFESLRGKSLREEIEAAGGKGLAPARVLAVAADVARGLARVHELGFVHRGITPDSITITTDGQVKLIALGLLRPAVQEEEDDGTGTMPGDILGSLAHMAPEQTTNPAQVDPRADVYALGAVMYHALAGRPPYSDASRLVSGGDPQPIGKLVPATPAPLAQLVTHCMARAPAQRFASGAEVLTEIERVTAQLRGPAGPAQGGPRGGGMPQMPTVPTFPTAGPSAAGPGVSSAGFFAGRLRGMQIVELLQMVELHDEAGTLEIMADEGPRGQLSFTGGRVVTATCGAATGVDAVYELLSVKRGFFRMAYGKIEPDPTAPTIGAILFEHMRRTDEGG